MAKKRRRGGTQEKAYTLPVLWHRDPKLASVVADRRVRYQVHWLEQVIDAAFKYRAEQTRDDPAHGARMSLRERSLQQAINDAYENWHPTFTKTDIEFLRRLHGLDDETMEEEN